MLTEYYCDTSLTLYSLSRKQIIPREAKPKAERSEVTNRVASGQTTWLASPSKSSREFLYMYIYIFIYMFIYIYILKVSVRGHVSLFTGNLATGLSRLRTATDIVGYLATGRILVPV